MYIIRPCVYLFVFMVLVSSCKIVQPPSLPSLSPVPDTFVGETDTISMADMIWEDFFNDPHLVTLIDTALTRNLDLLRATQRIAVARANLHESRGALLPSLDATVIANLGDNPNNVQNINRDGGDNRWAQSYFFGLQSSWEADLWGRLRAQREADNLRLLATEKGRHLVITSLVAEVARLYYELLGLDNELKTIEKNIAFQEIALEMIRIQKLGGRATELAVQQFAAQLLRTKSLGFEKKQRIVAVENQLNLLLGRYPQPIRRGESILTQHLPDIVRAGVPSSMLLRRPDVQQSELALAAAKADIAAARAAFLPSLVISPFVGVGANELPPVLRTPESLAMGAVGGLVAPLLSKNRLRANYNRTVAQTTTAAYDYHQTILTGYEEVVTSLKRIENYREVYALREQEAAVLSDAVSTANDLFAAGYATYLEVITAQARVLEAELGVTNTRQEIFIAIIDLYRALGGGWK